MFEGVKGMLESNDKKASRLEKLLTVVASSTASANPELNPAGPAMKDIYREATSLLASGKLSNETQQSLQKSVDAYTETHKYHSNN